ncbi:ATP12 family protein [Swingsia samuiensis]|uniref:ATP12 chaperone protein n=1 Tax=Swingsia samuiensis TaxID=1293412 RepID=A0A4Y6UI71_9PROT|nr:ATP12 family protein [Swingsia samuiensis]QDH17273.1 ATP12 chaperone protein [Swingsia samuiensis]
MSNRKRFWKNVTVGEENGLFSPHLDDRPLRLPQGTVLAVASKPLAEAVAKEWENIAADAVFSPEDLPLTRITGTFLERVKPHLGMMREELFKYGIDDELYYRADEHNPVLEKIFSWMAGLGLYPKVTHSFMPVEQSEEYRKQLKELITQQAPVELAVLGVITPVLGSLLLGVALIHHIITSEEALSVTNSDEQKQLLTWGYDSDLERTIKTRQQDIDEAILFLKLAKEI